jgi:hypothetical protein
VGQSEAYPAEISEEDRRELNEIECWQRDARLMKKIRAPLPRFANEAMIAIAHREQKIKRLQQEIANLRERLTDRLRVEFDKES